MAATALTVLSTVSPYGAGPGSGAALVAADTGNGNSFANDGRTYLVASNTDSSDHTLTIRGAAWTVPAGKAIVTGPFPTFEQFGSTVTVTGSDATVKLLAYSQSPGASAKR
jgi:hypothetical protein